jgi:hypothetical protein
MKCSTPIEQKMLFEMTVRSLQSDTAFKVNLKVIMLIVLEQEQAANHKER